MKKVLIVDDDPVSRRVLTGLFEDHDDLVIDLVEDGQGAVDAFRGALEADTPYLLVCLDYYLPIMDGKAALKMMRDMEAAAGIDREHRTPIVMVSSEDDETHIVKLFTECDASDYITKPFERRRIENIIQRYIHGQKDIDGIYDDHIEARARREHQKKLKEMRSRFLEKRHGEDKP